MAEELHYLFMLLFLSPAPGVDVQTDSSSKANSSLLYHVSLGNPIGMTRNERNKVLQGFLQP